MDTDDFTLGLMMACWVKIICREKGRETTAIKTSVPVDRWEEE